MNCYRFAHSFASTDNSTLPSPESFHAQGKRRAGGRGVIAGLLLACLTLFAPQTRAQGIIVRGGMNFSYAELAAEPTNPPSPEMRRSYNAAILAELHDGPIRLTAGAGYEERGAKLGSGDVTLDYLTVPVMITIGPPSINARAGFFLNVGVEPAFLIASSTPGGSTILNEDDIREFDVNGRVEIGIELPFSYSGPSLLLGGAYTLGFMDVNTGPDAWRSHTFHALMGIKMRSL